MNYKAVIFDLDGTLLDTLRDLADSVNEALEAFSFPQRTLQEVRSFVGDGVAKLIERAVPPATPGPTLTELIALYRSIYSRNMQNKTCAYEGIPELLHLLKKAGLRTGVCSNKGDAHVKALCMQYFGDTVDAAIGDTPESKRKPAPDNVFRTIAQLEVRPEEVIYIGDSEVDIETARNAELPLIAVSWGFRDRTALEQAGASCIVHSVEELRHLLLPD